ncbi:hypothetical protein BV25DRAFT_1815495 [Artomyces pyxidatus]|uniref:Uncharacterized protein n=1 Tax=Artomyces pyxidatus TaxID=48021 RepID=A0ACB8SGC0_9AGAM|nr:hypothetical protein BV25DRAFT_1815495 [Artomyces pyxidatus]
MPVFLVSPTGNAARPFPHHGYLGLTPLTVHGSVVVRFDKPLPARSLAVHLRCYEAQHGRAGPIHANIIADTSQVLWQAAHPSDPAPLPDLDSPFRLSLPQDSPGFSTAYYQEYRVFWRLEAVITHPYILGIGNRQVKSADLNVLRYDPNPAPHLPLSFAPPAVLPHTTTKPRAPVLRYHIAVPDHVLGPHDLLSVSVALSARDPSVSVRSASLTVERRMHIRDPPASTSDSILPANSLTPPTSPEMPSPYSPNASSYTLDSVATATSRSPLVPSHGHDPPPAAKLVSHIIAGTESPSGRFVRDDATGVWSRTLTLQWPAPRSTTRWAVGETMTTDMVNIAFFVKVKLIVSSASGTDSIELREQQVRIAATNNAERQLALSKYNAALARPPSSPPERRQASASTSTSPDAREKRTRESSSSKRSQRPHTSGGRPHTSGGRPHTSGGTASSSESGAWRPGSASASAAIPVPVPALPAIPAMRHNTITGETSVQPMPAPPGEHIRAWEEELERIEARSRRAGVGLGVGRRKVGVGGD